MKLSSLHEDTEDSMRSNWNYSKGLKNTKNLVGKKPPYKNTTGKSPFIKKHEENWTPEPPVDRLNTKSLGEKIAGATELNKDTIERNQKTPDAKQGKGVISLHDKSRLGTASPVPKKKRNRRFMGIEKDHTPY